MAVMNFKHITRSTNPNAYRGGYKNTFLFAPRADFLALSKPEDPETLLGGAVSITGDHTFTDPKGWLQWDCKTNSVNLKGTTVGEDGSQEIEWTAEFLVMGDDATTQEQMQRMVNTDLVCLLKESACLVDDSYVQLGDECVSPIVKVEFDSHNTKEGKKEYKVTVSCKVKYFYDGAVTMSTEEES